MRIVRHRSLLWVLFFEDTESGFSHLHHIESRAHRLVLHTKDANGLEVVRDESAIHEGKDELSRKAQEHAENYW